MRLYNILWRESSRGWHWATEIANVMLGSWPLNHPRMRSALVVKLTPLESWPSTKAENKTTVRDTFFSRFGVESFWSSKDSGTGGQLKRKRENK